MIQNMKKLISLPLGALILTLLPQVGEAQQPAIGTVQSLQSGDRACYVRVLDEDGSVSTEYASFEICNQNLVGRRANLTYETANIQAESCQGNPECTATEQVMLLVDADVIEPPAVGTIRGMVSGDRACYVDVVDDAGRTSTEYAYFEICEQNLVGRRVNLTYAVGNILAASCQGNVECGLSDTVTLITQATVIPSPNQLKVSNLPDGNYRYWTGTPNGAIVSDAELLEEGGVVFRFSKRGNNVTGIFAYVDGETICVSGQANGNTVTGIAVQIGRSGVLSSNDTFANFGPSSALKVRRGLRTAPQRVIYNSAILNLNGFNRINAGIIEPPGLCP